MRKAHRVESEAPAEPGIDLCMLDSGHGLAATSLSISIVLPQIPNRLGVGATSGRTLPIAPAHLVARAALDMPANCASAGITSIRRKRRTTTISRPFFETLLTSLVRSGGD